MVFRACSSLEVSDASSNGPERVADLTVPTLPHMGFRV